ncbi:MAG: galactokinase [Planctomycetia bacterium]|nr:galactokinase [Planctomycetia bacterium]
MADNLFDKLLEDTIALYQVKFGDKPQIIVRAPGRVNLIGEHTDYNGGYVFPMAIERYTVIAASPNQDGVAKIYSDATKELATFQLDANAQPAAKVRWSSYVQGAISCSIEKGAHTSGFNAVINSNVPLGGGLSSSASLEVAVATLMEKLSGVKWNPTDKPLLCQKAEHVYAKMACGIMDQFISALGQKDCAMLLDCRSQEPKMIPMTDPAVSVLIANSNVKHSLTGSEYPERRASCEEAAKRLGKTLLREVTMEELLAAKDKLVDEKNGDRLFRRARHAVGEDVRTLKMAEALVAQDWKTVGEQMYASHDSLRDDYEVSCPEIDVLVEIAREIGMQGGVIGSRITGGGFGGCTVSLVFTDKVEQIAKIYSQKYREKTGIAATIFSTRPAQGACVLQG